MLSVERVKKLLNDPTLTDEQIEEIRDGFHSLVEDVIFPAWLEDRNNKKGEGEGGKVEQKIVKYKHE